MDDIERIIMNQTFYDSVGKRIKIGCFDVYQ